MKIEDLYFNKNSNLILNDHNKEEWLAENPIDYFKLVYLLKDFPDEYFIKGYEIIYRITRLYNPKKIYKFVSLDENEQLNKLKIDTLKLNEIYLSKISDLNDPFDCKSFFYRSKEFMKYEIAKEYNGKIIDDFTNLVKIASFTSNDERNMPMWAHYSNNHSGYCLEYDLDENESLRNLIFKVQYYDERLDITQMLCESFENFMRECSAGEDVKIFFKKHPKIPYIASLLYNVKHISWNYENEYRILIANAEGIGDYVKAKPKKIYIGINCNEKNTELIKNIANSNSIEIYKMKINEEDINYNIVSTLI